MQELQPAWITGPRPGSAKEYRALYLTRKVDVARTVVVSAQARVSALGWYRLFVNGTDMTGNALVPRWTPFDQFVEYQDYAVRNPRPQPHAACMAR
jgi:alpha-L-rhamnosidase